MLVSNWMNKPVIASDANDSMSDAMKLLKENDINMLPVMSKGSLVGIVTDRDVKRSSASDATTLEIHELLFLISKIKVKEIMTEDPMTVPSDYTIEETAEVLLKKNISGVPVVDKKKVVGVITQSDIFRALISLTGVGKKGIQFAFEVEDRAGSIREVTDIIRKYGGRMVSILSSYENVTEGCRKVYIRNYGIERKELKRLKKELKEKANLLYMLDHRENRREIY